MDPEELWETTLKPENRCLVKVEMKDFEGTNDVMENLLNGNTKYADKRKEFLMENQLNVKNLDV